MTIQRFRGIRDLTVEGFAFVNVFVGANAAGKTSLLEAIAIAGGPTDPRFPARLSTWRGLPEVSSKADDGLRSLFADLRVDQPIELLWVADAIPCHLEIRASSRATFDEADPSSAELSSGTSGSVRLAGLEYRFERGTEPPIVTRLMTTTGGYQTEGVEYATSARVGFGSFFMEARRSASVKETARALTRATENRADDAVYRAVRRVDPRVRRLHVGFRDDLPIILADVGLPQLVPAYVLGDGFARVLLLVTGAFDPSCKLLLVDDIDSGLHSSVMASTWQTLIDLRDQRAFQVFCTTHNDEMLQSAIEAFADHPDLLRVFRIDRHADDRVTVQPYDFDLLRDVSAAGMDVR